MIGAPRVFLAVNDEGIAGAIDGAQRRVVFAAPGVGKLSGPALTKAIERLARGVTIILDPDPEVCRMGYGDLDALRDLSVAAGRHQVPLRRQGGLRVGVLIVDDTALIWSPTAQCVESEPEQDQPNGVALGPSAADACMTALGMSTGPVPSERREIGLHPLTSEDLHRTAVDLQRNPPAPFDLARRTRVFSSRFQFIEFEVRGAQWTERRINLSSVLLNADLPEALQGLLDTQLRPYQETKSPAFDVPHLVTGVRAFDAHGNRILVSSTQSQVMKYWAEIRDRYLRHLPGFGWLVKRDEVKVFHEAARAFEESLRVWVDAFRKHAAGSEDSLVKTIVDAITARIERSGKRRKLEDLDLTAAVCEGLKRMRVIEPQVRVVLKNVAWESTRDAEFVQALEKALSPGEREGWFEEFTAVRERKANVTP